MAKDLPCADCGGLMYRGKASLPEGQARCHPCRRLDKSVKPCERCGMNFKPDRAESRYCSRRCHNPPRSCEVCKCEYRPSYYGQRTCSRACGVQINARAQKGKPKPTSCAVAWRQCGGCDNWIAHPRRSVCNETCRKECNRRQSAERFVSQARPTTVRCIDCGEDYTTAIARNKGVCKSCQNKRRGNGDRGRARYFGVIYEPINRREVYDRDGWRCGLCGKRVRRDVQAPDPMSASLDHIVPLSRGGDHVYSNVQCAHLGCNVAKGNRGSQQLALVG